jgi:hypothetical protein
MASSMYEKELEILRSTLPQADIKVLGKLLANAEGDINTATNLYYDSIVSCKYKTRSKSEITVSEAASKGEYIQNGPNPGAGEGFWFRSEDGLEKKWVSRSTSPSIEAFTIPPPKKKRRSGCVGSVGVDGADSVAGSIVKKEGLFVGQTLMLWEEAHRGPEGVQAWRRDGPSHLLGRRARRPRESGKIEGFITAWRPSPSKGPSEAEHDHVAAKAKVGECPGAEPDTMPTDESACNGGYGGNSAISPAKTDATGGEERGDGAAGAADVADPGHTEHDDASDREWRLLYVDGDEAVLTVEEAQAAVRAAGPRSVIARWD